jgi:tetratricopeptide (TPR) repeat protein
MTKSRVARLVVGCAFAVLAYVASSGFAASAPDLPAGVASGAFYLLTAKNPENIRTRLPLFERELYRQALLIAARDGMGLQTRDESLREWRVLPAAQGAWNLKQMPLKIEIAAGTGQAIWTAKRIPSHNPLEIADRVGQIEALSRGEFVKLLQGNGYSGKGNPIKPAGAAPDDAEARLGDLEELSQFRVLRETHDAIRKDGESETRLGVLVRGYANLGQLTRYHWSIEHQVYMARSLLYAARMVNANPKSPVPLWHRAYAMALAGFQEQAFKDLDAVARLADKTKPPGWVELLTPFCHYNLGKLTDLAAANAGQAPLATYLAFLTIETSGCNVAMLSTSQVAFEKNPRCLRVIDAMCANTGPGLLNALADLGPQVFSVTLVEKLETMQGIPQAVSRQIGAIRAGDKGPVALDAVWQALIDQGTPGNDSTELSWAALGREIQETVFAQIRRKADLIALKWGVDASDYVAGVQGLISDHRFKGIIDAYGAWHEPSRERKVETMKRVGWEDLTLSELPAYHLESTLQSHGPGSANRMLNSFHLDMDTSSFDSEVWLALYNGQLKGNFLDTLIWDLKSASPESPWIACADILNHWDAGKAQEWEQSHGGYPSIQLALGKKYTELGQWDDAVRCMRRYIRVSPDFGGYQSLAHVYKTQGRDDLWLDTLKEFLTKTEAIALEHAQVQVEIADYYMARHQYKDALPLADAAAGTGAAWGLQCAARVHTGAGQFAQAEDLLIEEVQHYGNSPYPVVLWCFQTQRGHRDAAIKGFFQYIASRGGNLSQEDALQLALIDEAQGKVGDAIAELNKRFKKAQGPLSLYHVVIFADESGDAKALRDAVKQLAELKQGDPAKLEFAGELVKAFQTPASTLDLKAIDALIQKSNKEAEKIEFRIMTARYLLKRGQKDAALRYVNQCYSGFHGYCADNLLVYETTRTLGLDPLTLADPAPQPRK